MRAAYKSINTERSEVGANTPPLRRSKRQTPLWLSTCTVKVYIRQIRYLYLPYIMNNDGENTMSLKEKRKESYRVVVCGTNFGRIYIEGVKRNSNCKLVGILSRGSLQSKKCAVDNKVTLYTDVAQLDSKEIDIVCIAVKSSITGGKGTEIALECLKRGINVIQEQPVHYKDAQKCYKKALEHHCHYYINSFYSEISAGKLMIEYSNKLMYKTAPILIEAECSVQVLYPLLDIIGNMIGTATSYKMDKLESKNKVFDIIEGEIGKIPLILKIENRMVPEDPDNYALMFHRIIFFTGSGQLVMDNSIGIVFWEPRYFIEKKNETLNFEGNNIYSKQKIVEILNEDSLQDTYKDIYYNLWPQGISDTIDKFIGLIEEGTIRKNIQYQLNICKLWEDIGKSLGTVRNIPIEKIMPINKEDILR